MKRIFDFFVSLISLCLLLPVFILVSLFIFFDNPGLVFFMQQRVGMNGKLFEMYKFRSMKVGSDKIGPYFTSENDNRITKVGSFLRRTSIDELPQLLNVLKGHMSIVGPRPNVEQQKKTYEESVWNKRNTVRPGITGLAQATTRSLATAEERNELDLYYVEKNNFILDLKIIFMTIKQVFTKGGN